MASCREITNLFVKLNITDIQETIAVLQDLKTALFSVHPSVLSGCVHDLQIDKVFDCLNSSEIEQIELCCEILQRLLDVLEPNVLALNFVTELSRGLCHPNSNVKILSLKQVNRCCADSTASALISNHLDLLLLTVNLLGDDNMSVSKEAGKALKSLTLEPTGLNVIFSNAILNTLTRVEERNDTLRYRVLELMIHISSQGSKQFELVSNAGFFQQLFDEIYKDDVLVQLNALDLLTDFALKEHGLLYLEQHQITQKLEEMLTSVQIDPLANFLVPGLIKFFGNLGRFRPKEVCTQHKSFIDLLFKHLKSEDTITQGLAIDTVGIIGSTVEGKLALAKQGKKLDGGLHDIGAVIANAPSDLRVRAMHTASVLLTIEVSEQNEEILSLAESWLNKFMPDMVHKIADIIKQPFVDIRCSALSVFKALALTPFGQRALKTLPGFIEYIVDRNTENTKDGKEAKYEIIKALIESPTVEETFGVVDYLKLKAYYMDGPFYIEAEHTVAMENIT